MLPTIPHLPPPWQKKAEACAGGPRLNPEQCVGDNALRRGLMSAGAALLLLAGCASPPAPPAEPAQIGTALPPLSGETVPGNPSPAPEAPAGASPLVAAGRVPVQKIDGADYYNAVAFFARYGLTGTLTTNGKHLQFRGGGQRLDFVANEREVTLNGLRIYLGAPALLRVRAFYVSRADAERLLGPILSPASVTVPPPTPHVIVLDPGHGGQDAGTTNATLGVVEKTFTLAVAQRLRPLLEAKGYQVVLTRTEDHFIPLPQRPAIAGQAHADLFISIHFNSVAPDTKTTGTEIYTFPPQGERSTRSWSVGEKDDSESKADPSNHFDHWNAVLAHAIHGAALAKLGTFDRGQKMSHYAVLRGLDCPGVLVECAFLSNDAEARKVTTSAFQQKIAEGIADGVAAYAARLAAK